MNIQIFQSCLEKVESWATSLPSQGKSAHAKFRHVCGARFIMILNKKYYYYIIIVTEETYDLNIFYPFLESIIEYLYLKFE